MNFTDVEALPPVAAHLLTLGQTFADVKRHRSAALAYSAVARASGTTRYHQAYALYKAAQQLQFSQQTTDDEYMRDEDRTRSLGYLQKCSMLIRDIPSSFGLSMQVFALIESISTEAKDFKSASKTISAALDTVAAGEDDPDLQLRWWCYFRGRAICNALADTNSVQQAAALATESASLCEQGGDILSAAAFYLVNAQIALGASALRESGLSVNVEPALRCMDQLQNGPPGREFDYLLCKFGAYILENLECLRRGDLRVLRDGLNNLSTSYSHFRQTRKQELTGHWRWLPDHYLSALTYFIFTAASRSNGDMNSALIRATTALTRYGISKDRLSSLTLTHISAPTVPVNATVSFAVALLENAARIRLTQVALDQAAKLIGAASDLAFREDDSRSIIRLAEKGTLPTGTSLNSLLQVRNTSDRDLFIPRSTTFLLIAEYHNLRGRISTARIATSFLDALRATESPSNSTNVSDTWQIAVSYLSLLTGDERRLIATIGGEALPVPETEDSNFSQGFVSSQVLALAWFTVGVYHMRKMDVLESRKAVTNCLDIVNLSPFGNEQLISNASSVLSGLVMPREHVTDEGHDTASTAVELARQFSDPVTFLRAVRQQRKVLHRVSQSQKERLGIDEIVADAFKKYADMTEHVGAVFESCNIDEAGDERST